MITRRQFLRDIAISAAAMTTPKPLWADGGRILRVSGAKPIRAWDPPEVYGTLEYCAQTAIYNRLLTHAPGEKWTLINEAAEYVDAVDGTHIKFKLKQGIKFTNGYGEMTADDVKFSYERHFDPKINSQMKDNFGPMAGVEVTGRYTGVIVLKEPFPPFTDVVIAHSPGMIVSKKATLEAGGKFNLPPCSSGPYKLKRDTGKRCTILERNDLWVGPPADFDEIHIKVIEDPKNAESAYDAGEIDFTQISLDSISNYVSNPRPNTTLLTRSTLRYLWLGINTENEVTKNEHLRRAIQYAINVDEILEKIYFGSAKRATGIIAPGLVGHRPKNLIEGPDLVKAGLSLKKAGYPNGLKLTLDVQNTELFPAIGRIVQKQLIQAGIEVEVILRDSSSFWGLGNETKGDSWKNIQLILNRFNSLPDPFYATVWFTKDQIGIWNWERFDNEEYNRLHVDGARELDPQKRDLVYRRMQDLLEESGAYVFITYPPELFLYRNHVIPALRPDGTPLFRYFQVAR
ncbi:MAG: ABC transporter substrate-binding protein [Thermodesulfobacteriota bacterium]